MEVGGGCLLLGAFSCASLSGCEVGVGVEGRGIMFLGVGWLLLRGGAMMVGVGTLMMRRMMMMGLLNVKYYE